VRPDIPALKHQSDCYPSKWMGRVPKKVRMLQTVRPDLPQFMRSEDWDTIALNGEQYDAYTNSHGVVCAFVAVTEQNPDGKLLGLKPDEFEIVEWYY